MPIRSKFFLLAMPLAVALTATGPARADAPSPGIERSSLELSAQTRTDARRRARTAPARITVRPLRQAGPLRRECVPVFEQRLIPQWGGLVLYASQRCWWTRAPLAPDEVF